MKHAQQAFAHYLQNIPHLHNYCKYKNFKPYLYLLSLEKEQDILLLALSFPQNVNYIRSYPLNKQRCQHGNKHESMLPFIL